MKRRYLLVIVVLVGITSISWTEEIQATSFTVVDDQGRIRAFMGMLDGTPGLILLGENGNPRIMLDVDNVEDVASITLYNPRGMARIMLYEESDGVQIVLYDETGMPGIQLHTGEDGPGLFLHGLNGSGLSGFVEDGAKLVMFDESRKKIWSVPED